MLEFYLGCLTMGILFALVTVIFGDLFSDFLGGFFEALSFDHLDFFHPVVFMGGLTVFGGCGAMLEKYSVLDKIPVTLLSLLGALIFSFLSYFLYVKPMKNAENSTGFSIQDLVGKIGEVVVPIPTQGCGETLFKIGAGYTNQIAASFDGTEIAVGSKAVVAEVKEGILYVFPYED